MTPLQFATRATQKIILPMAPRSFRLPFQYYLRLIEGRYEPELRHLDAICQNRNVAIDVGTGVGLYSYKLSHLFQRVLETDSDGAGKISFVIANCFIFSRAATFSYATSKK